MSLHNRIREARKLKGLTQTELGDLIGVAKTTIAGYEKNREPTAAQRGEIADVLDVDVTFLLQDEIKRRRDNYATAQEMEHIVKKYRSLDAYGKEAVEAILEVEFRRMELVRKQKQQMEAAEEITPVVSLRQPYTDVAAAEGSGAFLMDDNYDEVLVEINDCTRRADVILKVVGRSMEPEIADGDRVLVRIQPSVNIGEIGVFIIDGQGYLKERAADRLVSLNPEVKDVFVGDLQQAECYGKFISVLDQKWVVER